MVPQDATTPAHPVRALRKAQRLTQAELGKAVGVSRQTIVAVEQGDYAPSVFLALRIAGTLGTTVEGLFGDQDPQQKTTSGGRS
ncbi:helix-turn-helix transcriptional regulator [Nesterenkonia muleiensis]|uniref:helix-turn-helix transcriptional regulator n=1 Tax=Nesterenkonia muleiensis TaxID=2282648 RepID=UPI000E73E47C|nr:helix-turn-helix transcriptional regulator [Nesterenkonia muleiensis]